MSDIDTSGFDKSTVICTPSDALNSYGIFKDSHFISGGYLEKYQVPHTNDDFLNFTKQHGIGSIGDVILFNCGGEFSGIVITGKELERYSSRTVSYKEKVMSPSQVRKFMLKQGGSKDWPIKNYYIETKDWSEAIFEYPPSQRRPVRKQVREKQNLIAEHSSGGCPNKAKNQSR